MPLVTQLEPLEGGYACLAMILAYHRKLVSLGQIKADCGSIKKVPDLDSISQMASFYGLEAERKTVSFSELCSEDAFPCIVTWDRYRYVVIAGVSRSGKYIVNDPANGGRALLLLQSAGVIKLKDGAGATATPLDIADNPKRLRFTEVEAAQVPRTLDDVDVAIVNSNYALGVGLPA